MTLLGPRFRGPIIHFGCRGNILPPPNYLSLITSLFTIFVVLQVPAVVPAIAWYDAQGRSKIVVVGPESGPFAKRTSDMVAGVRAALRHFGQKATRVSVQVVKEECELQSEVDLPNGAVVKGETDQADKSSVGGADPEVIVIGHACERTAVTAAHHYALQQTVFLAPMVRHPALTDDPNHTTTLRLTGRNDRQGVYAGYYLSRRYSPHDVIILQDRTRFARELSEDVARAWPSPPERNPQFIAIGHKREVNRTAGFVRPKVLSFVTSQTSYQDLIEKIKLESPKAIYLAAFPTEAEIILSELASAGIDTVVYGPDTLSVDPINGAKTLPYQIRDVWVSLPVDAAKMENSKSLVARLKGEKLQANDTMVRAYVATEIWWKSTDRRRGLKGQGLIEAIRARSSETAIGVVQFDYLGDMLSTSYRFQRLGSHRSPPR